MKAKIKHIFRFFVAILITLIVLVSGVFIGWYFPRQGSGAIKKGSSIDFGKLSALFQSNKTDGSVLSGIVEMVTVGNSISTQIASSPTIQPVTPTPIKHKITFNDFPIEIMEGGQAIFTWTIDGLSRTIHKTAVYFGTGSTQGVLTKDIPPEDTKYTDSVKDFIQGDYVIPLRFIGSAIITKPGIYFARAYALIDSKNYWSEERMFTVKQMPKHEIRLINYPDSAGPGTNLTFTWEILGPEAKTGFTTIVGGKQSKLGILDETVDVPQTPYTILVSDFINGTTYNVPLRFIGNAAIQESGTYYFRALASINGKNIWSDEYSLSIQ